MTEGLSDVLARYVRNGQSQIHTAMPAEVRDFDAGERKASVLPLFKRRLPDGEEQRMPIIRDVPVSYPASTDAGMTWPLERGDKVLLVFAERSIDEWLDDGGEVLPSSNRRHDLSDAVAIPGVYPFDSGPDVVDGVQIKYKGARVKVEDGAVALGTDLVELLDRVSAALTAVATHTHDGGTTPPPDNAPQFEALSAEIDSITGSL